MKHAISLLALSLALAGPAHAGTQARTWFILDFSDGVCKRPPAGIQSPDVMHKAIRASGQVDDVKVVKSDDGAVQMVTIEMQRNGGPVTSVWFPSKQECELLRIGMQGNGDLPDSADLK